MNLKTPQSNVRSLWIISIGGEHVSALLRRDKIGKSADGGPECVIPKLQELLSCLAPGRAARLMPRAKETGDFRLAPEGGENPTKGRSSRGLMRDRVGMVHATLEPSSSREGACHEYTGTDHTTAETPRGGPALSPGLLGHRTGLPDLHGLRLLVGRDEVLSQQTPAARTDSSVPPAAGWRRRR